MVNAFGASEEASSSFTSRVLDAVRSTVTAG
jgi:hypothetical protein